MRHNTPPTVLTIAGTDPSGGAGIQADIKAISATGSYAASVITALVAQNTLGVQAIHEIPTSFIKQQMNSVFDDLSVSAIKIGMLHDEMVIKTVFEKLKKCAVTNLVLDPVMVTTSGHLLLAPEAIDALKEAFRSFITLMTPNLFEAQQLLGQRINNLDEMYDAAKSLGETYQTNILIKGGHLESDESPDILYLHQDKGCTLFENKRIQTENTHGTGCTLSSAIASYLAQGKTLVEAVELAKAYLTKAIDSAKNHKVGHGSGPVDHFYFL